MHSLFAVTFSNPDPNKWDSLCIAGDRNEQGNFYIVPTFFGVVSPSDSVYVSARILVSGDVMDMKYMTKIFVTSNGSPFSIASVQESRIREIRAI